MLLNHVESGQNVPPAWPDVVPDAVAVSQSSFDAVLAGMVAAGLGIEALSLYLGLSRTGLYDRLSFLGLPTPHDRPMRRAGGKSPWAPEHVGQLIALWTSGVHVQSIADALSRSRGSIYAKRRRLGLPPRERKTLHFRPAEDCRAATPLCLPAPRPSVETPHAAKHPPAIEHSRPPFRPAPLLRQPAPGAPKTDEKPAKPMWRLGRDTEKDERFSVLGFAGLKASVIAERMATEFGLKLSISAVNNRLSRLQIVRDREKLIDFYDAEEIEARAAANKKRLGAVIRKCDGLGRHFWYYRTIGGNRNTCREFDKAVKYSARKSHRSSGEVFGCP